MRLIHLPTALLIPILVGCSPTRWLPHRSPPRSTAAAPPFRDPMAAGQLVFHADFALPPGHRMVAELTSERQLICDRLGIPAGREPIHVYLFGDEATYRAHVSREYPGFPERRAIFVETDVRLSVYAHWSDHVADDLRHEVAHGYLHSAVPNLPLWLDEGLAEYFEVGRGRSGVNRTHVDDLTARRASGGWRPDLPRLEQLTVAAEMTQADYAESWLWVHLMLESDAACPEILAAHLSSLRNGVPPENLSAKLERQLSDRGGRDATAAAHLQSLAE